MHRKTCYLTGTDTDAGKTWVTSECLTALSDIGASAVGMKPVASGCTQTDQGLRNDDALRLMAAGKSTTRYELHNPFALPEPTAPEIAARHAGVEPDLESVMRAYRELQMHAGIVLVEGVGGWLAPLSRDIEQADLVRALGCPVVLVVGLKLGCINHARLTERALHQEGIEYIGWIAAEIDPDLLFAAEYFDSLRRCMSGPCLGRVFADETSRLEGFTGLFSGNERVLSR